MAEEKRVRRTSEQISAAIGEQIEELQVKIELIEEQKQESAAKFDERIRAINQKIATLRKKQENLLSPKPRKKRVTKTQKIKNLVTAAQKSGKSLEEIADALGVDMSELG